MYVDSDRGKNRSAEGNVRQGGNPRITRRIGKEQGQAGEEFTARAQQEESQNEPGGARPTITLYGRRKQENR